VEKIKIVDMPENGSKVIVAIRPHSERACSVPKNAGRHGRNKIVLAYGSQVL
jgi:hypothetical protein